MIMSTATVQAAPWIDPGDERLRHHLTVLADAGVLNVPMTSWPLMWGAVMESLQQADSFNLTPAEQWSLEYVQFSYGQASQSIRTYAAIGVQSEITTFANFGTDQREKSELKSESDWVGRNLAVRVRATWANDASDGKDARLDGSYLAGVVGNWSFSAGAIDRWWGPGWQSSLILSNNARPVPALMLQRNFSEPFSWPILEWLGHWTFTSFIGQMESHRYVSETKLVGARFAFKPSRYLELGFSRTAQWGGEGRPEDLSNLWNLMVGNDNVGDDGIDVENQPGNQLGAVDFRLGGTVLGTHSALYTQYVGEDESNAFPSKGFYLFGLETAFASTNVHHRLFLEYTDTTSGGDDYNTSYEHDVYLSGYRYRGRPIGASFDNDSKVITLAGAHYFSGGDEFSWRISKLDINQDGANSGSPTAGNVYGDKATNLEFVELRYATIFNDLKISTAVTQTTNELNVYGQSIDGTGFSIAIEYKP